MKKLHKEQMDKEENQFLYSWIYYSQEERHSSMISQSEKNENSRNMRKNIIINKILERDDWCNM